jgi:protein-S-isoprenylcysteine O-methyltransferase Ste14
MSLGLFLLLLVNIAFIAILPKLFFKRGKFNLMWCLTGSPFAVCALVLILNRTGHLQVFAAGLPYRPFLEPVAMLLSVASFSLICFTLGTHRVPLALWHQKDDAPQSIVTYGAYGKIRHPFYASFLMAFLAAFLYAPQAGTLATLLAGFLILNGTAAREERRLSASEFGADYQAYIARTGRFFPRIFG